MYDQSRDDVERIAKMRRIKNYEAMLKEELIISLLKSKPSIAEPFKIDYFTKLGRILNKKEEHGYHDHDDLDYNRIRDIENLFSKVAEEDYYKPILVKSSFKRSYKYYESRGDGNKNLSTKQYLSGL